MNGLTVHFDEYSYHFDNVKGYWVCNEDNTTMSTDSIVKWLKHDATIIHDRAITPKEGGEK